MKTRLLGTTLLMSALLLGCQPSSLTRPTTSGGETNAPANPNGQPAGATDTGTSTGTGAGAGTGTNEGAGAGATVGGSAVGSVPSGTLGADATQAIITSNQALAVPSIILPGLANPTTGVVAEDRTVNFGAPTVVKPTAVPGPSVTGIVLTPMSVVLTPGGSTTLTSKVSMSNGTTTTAVTWSTSDPSVANFSLGRLVATGKGVVRITAAASLDPSFMAFCDVHVGKTVVLPDGRTLITYN